VSDLVRRQRPIGVRLSEAECAAKELFFIEIGTRRISALARITINTYVNRATEEGLSTSAADQNAAHSKSWE
jgi:hypothetical protein